MCGSLTGIAWGGSADLAQTSKDAVFSECPALSVGIQLGVVGAPVSAPSPRVPLMTATLRTQVEAKERGAAVWQRSPLSNGPSAAGWIMKQMSGCRAAVPQTALSGLTLPCNTTCKHITVVPSSSGMAQTWKQQLLCLNVTTNAFVVVSKREFEGNVSAESGGGVMNYPEGHRPYWQTLKVLCAES